jgi:uncharacterized membrane protein
MSLRSRIPEKLPGIVVFLTVGLGIGGGYLGFDTGLIWVLGFAVLLPLAGILAPDGDEATKRNGAGAAAETAVPTDPLDRLRDRYARGELSEEAFERKLEALLETETPEGARQRVDRTERAEHTERERIAESE